MRDTERRLSVLESLAVARQSRAGRLAPGDWYRWASTGELPAGEAARAQIEIMQRRRQAAEAVLADFAETEPGGEDPWPKRQSGA